MKFKAPYEGNYDPNAHTFTISGPTVAGNKGEAVLPLTRPDEFMAWLAGCLREPGAKAGTLAGTLTTNSIAYALYPGAAQEITALVISIELNGTPLSFGLPIRNLTKEQIDTLGSLFASVTAIIEHADSGAVSN